MNPLRRLLAICVLLLLAFPSLGWTLLTADAFSGPESKQLFLYTNRNDVFVNGAVEKWNVPPVLMDGTLFVPLSAFSRTAGAVITYDPAAKATTLTRSNVRLRFFLTTAQYQFEGAAPVPFGKDIKAVSGQLWVKLSRISSWFGFVWRFDPVMKRYEVVWGNEVQPTISGRPLARFTTDKSSYKIGEKITYTNISLDPDGGGIVKSEWAGKQDTFFKEGLYPVTLTVTDRAGLVSKPYTSNVRVTPEVYLPDLFTHQLFYASPGTHIPIERSAQQQRFRTIPQASKTVNQQNAGTLIVSNSPESVDQPGLLYKDTVQGDIRVYASHVNRSDQPLMPVLVIKNLQNEQARIELKRVIGEQPTVYAHVLGYAALMDEALIQTDNVPESSKLIELPAGESKIVYRWPVLESGYGLTMISEFVTDRPVECAVMMIPADQPELFRLDEFPQLTFNGHLRGTFGGASLAWQVQSPADRTPFRITLGDGTYDQAVTGIDVSRMVGVTNKGNYGVVYTIEWANAGRNAIVLQPRGGGFKGVFRINGQFVQAPVSGVVTPFDGVVLLYRTRPDENMIQLHYSPPAGSAFPVDLHVLPLPDK